MKHLIILCILMSIKTFGCRPVIPNTLNDLRQQLNDMVDTVPGTVGIAVILGTDTLSINNDVEYPMMSVFKLHQALAVADELECRGNSLDSIISIHAYELDPSTWSPMVKEHGIRDFGMSIAELIRYTITGSDNNASNIMFRRIVSPDDTDKFVKSVANDTTFCIQYSESEMKADHTLSYSNHTTPLATAELIRQVYETDLVSAKSQDCIRECLSAVTTGQDRLGSIVSQPDVKYFGHKTGSGYRNDRGELIAHNDVGYFVLSDGRSYSIAVLIKNFGGSESEASDIIANISRCVYESVCTSEHSFNH